MDYKDSGVDIEKGDHFVSRIKKMLGTTYNDKVVTDIGGFAALYDIDDDRYLAAATDGVGTKLKIAIGLDKHDTIGIDLVAMCVNDIICTGAKPLFFLDYLASGNLNLATSEAIVKGIVEGCKQSQMALIGGETAEMPGIYQDKDYDMAGFCVGEVTKEKIIDGTDLKIGDSIIGLASSGFHSNGYSLIRKLIATHEVELLEDALTPTTIYVKAINNLIKKYGRSIKGVAHITGSGFLNIPRINETFGYDIDFLPTDGEIPSIISTIAGRSKLSWQQLYRTFNMGIGMVLITDNPYDIISSLEESDQKSWKLGNITSSFKGVKIKGAQL